MTTDGSARTDDDVSDDERSHAQIAYLAVFCFGFLAPLIVYLTSGRKDPFVRHHSSESLNFQVTYMLVLIVCCVVGVLTEWGLVLVPLVVLLMVGFQIRGAIAAGRSQWYRFPVSIRLWPGAVERA